MKKAYIDGKKVYSVSEVQDELQQTKYIYNEYKNSLKSCLEHGEFIDISYTIKALLNKISNIKKLIVKEFI